MASYLLHDKKLKNTGSDPELVRPSLVLKERAFCHCKMLERLLEKGVGSKTYNDSKLLLSPKHDTSWV